MAVSSTLPDSLPGDRRFFHRVGPFSLADLAAVSGADIREAADGRHGQVFTGVAPLHVASPDEVSFLDNRRYLPLLEETKAGAVILGPAFSEKLPAHTAGLISKAPYLAWARVASHFHPVPSSRSVRHPSAIVGDNVQIGENVEIGPLAVIGDGARIGAGSVISAHAVIGENVQIGEN